MSPIFSQVAMNLILSRKELSYVNAKIGSLSRLIWINYHQIQKKQDFRMLRHTHWAKLVLV